MVRATGFALAFLCTNILAPCVANAQETIKIGVISALTGPAAPWGLALEAGVKMATEEANAKGGLDVAGKKYKLEVISYDEQYKAAVAVSAARRLIDQEQAHFIFGPLSSAGTLAVRDILQQNKVISIMTGFSRKALDANAPYMFRMFSTPVEFADPLVKWLQGNMPKDVKKVVILNPNDETGWDSTDVLKTAYAKYGFNVLGTELYERSVKDFQPVLIKLLTLQPELIELGTSAPATAGLLVRQARELGYKGRFSKIGGPGPREIVQAAGKEAAEGVINYMYTDTTNPIFQRMAEAYQKSHGHEMNDLVPISYDAARLLLAAIQKAGAVTDTDKVRAAIPQLVPFKTTLGGTVSLGGKEAYGVDTQFVTPAYVGEIKDGSIRTMHQVQ